MDLNDYVTYCLIGKAAYDVITVKACISFTAKYCIIGLHLKYSANQQNSYQNMLPICMVSSYKEIFKQNWLKCVFSYHFVLYFLLFFGMNK